MTRRLRKVHIKVSAHVALCGYREGDYVLPTSRQHILFADEIGAYADCKNCLREIYWFNLLARCGVSL